MIELAPADRIQIAKQVDDFGVPGPPQVVGQGKTLVIQGLRRKFRQIRFRAASTGADTMDSFRTSPRQKNTSRIIASRQNSADPGAGRTCESPSYHARESISSAALSPRCCCAGALTKLSTRFVSCRRETPLLVCNRLLLIRGPASGCRGRSARPRCGAF